MSDEKVDVLLEAKMRGLNEALKQIEVLRLEGLKAKDVFASYVDTFKRIDAAIGASTKQLAQFNRGLGNFAKGDTATKAIRAEINRALANSEGAMRDLGSAIVNKQASILKEINRAQENQSRLQKAGFKGDISSNPIGAAAALKALDEQEKAEKRIAAERKRANAEQLKDQQKYAREQEKITKKAETDAARAAKAAANFKTPDQKAAESRAFAVERVTGDGGASLFKIQASLLVNYTIMNQLFNLFQFGSQFVLELDKSFRNLQATIAATNGQMVGLKQSIIDVSKGTRFTAVEVAQAAEVLGQAGFSVGQIKQGLEGVTLLATATGSTLAQSVDVASSAVGIFNLRAEDLNHVANVMTASINDTKLTMDKLALGLQYVGNTAAEAGLSFEETTAVLGAMSNAGIRSGSTLGTGFRQLLTELISPSDKFAKSLQKVGLGIDDVDVKAKGFVGVMQTLSDAGFTASDAFETLDLRAAAAFAAIQNDPEIINRLQEGFLYSTAAAKANEVQMKSLSNVFDQFRGALGLFVNSTSGPVVSTLVTLTSSLSQLLNILGSAGPLLSIAGVAMTSFGIALAAVKFGDFLKGMLSAEVASKGLTAGLTAASAASGGRFAAALSAILSPLGKITIGISLFVGALTLLNSLLSSNAGELDELRTRVADAKGAFDTTSESITAVDENVQRLLNRFAELKASPAALVTEFRTLQEKFGSIGLELKNTTNPTIYELIEALRALRKELGAVAVIQLDTLLAEQSVLFRKQSEASRQKIATLRNAKQPGYDRYNSSDALTSQSYENVSTAQEFLRQASNTNLKGLPQQRIEEIKGQISGMINTLNVSSNRLQNGINNLAPQVQKGDKVAIQLTKAYEDSIKNNNLALGGIKTTMDELNKYSATFRESVQAKFDQSTVAQAYVKEIEDFKAQISELNKEKAEAKDDATKTKLSNKILELQNATKALLAKLIEDGFGPIIDALKLEVGGELPTGQEGSLKGGLETKGVQAIHDSNEKLVDGVSSTISAVDAAIDQAANLVQSQKEIFERLDDAYDTKIKQLDALMAEVTDLERGGLAGKYSDAELSAMQDRQKGLQIEGLKAKLGGGAARLASLDNLIGAQSAKVGKTGFIAGAQNTPDNIIAMAAAEKDLLATQRERADVVNELAIMQAQYNAMIGLETEAHMSLNEQIGYSLEKYSEQMAIQSQLGYNIKANITDMFNAGRDAFSGFLQDFLSGTKSMGESIKEFATSVLKSMLKIATDKVAGQLFGWFAGQLGGFLGGSVSAPTGTNGTFLPNTGGSLGQGISWNAAGGYVKKFASGGMNRDSVPAMLKPGEYVLRNQAVDMIGRRNLDNINAMGNQTISNSAPNVSGNMGGGDAGITNIWVVTPDQKPNGMGPKDVVVVVADDMAKNGTLKRLVKSIANGSM